MFTPYGYSTMIKALLICMLCSGAALFFPPGVKITLLIATTSFSLFTLYFFRDPERKAPNEQRIILAPADGRILLVQKQKGSTLVSIFMSPFNVHVNRIPISGRVTKVNYKPGHFLMAFDNRSMESNEKMEIGIDNGEISVLFSQISGFLARRIVCPLQRDEQVTIGNRFGMIKFGSRVDITLPPGAAVEVQVGQKSVAGRTILARY
ncbi:phosphatidylserine decarboxylase [Chlorobium sp. KB01]|uniref:phosphatidylserine decarboxylase n=1 Tax=Chlorobium sp. KB01 TaxID=1917528 RepID=UPI0009776A21|nr:phosphatidylserine decarboxylase [Chlorobium sp. KB01]